MASITLTVGMQAMYMDQWRAPEAFASQNTIFTVDHTFLQQLTEIAKNQHLSLPALPGFCGVLRVPDLILPAQDAFPIAFHAGVWQHEAPTITLDRLSAKPDRRMHDGVMSGTPSANQRWSRGRSG
jgi:hypothetical protein